MKVFEGLQELLVEQVAPILRAVLLLRGDGLARIDGLERAADGRQDAH
jgi:hypothetical protein